MSFAFPVAGFLNFLSYFTVAVALTLVFQFVYVKATPYNEVELIKKNNVAAATTYAGAFIGFVLPLVSVIAHSLSVGDMVLWGLIAGVVQLVTFFIFRAFYPCLAQSIQNGELARALKLATVSVGVGALNAACLTY